MVDITRRVIIEGAGALGLAPICGSSDKATPAAQEQLAQNDSSPQPPAKAETHAEQQRTTYLFFNDEEAAFIEAAVARLIPKDEQWGGALEAGVPNYMDKQLGGAWGAGERLYRSGPWQQGAPSQGYQLPLTPAELFHAAVATINKDLAAAGTPFAKMSADQQDAYLKKLEAGGQNLGGVPSEVFFDHLWELTLEGFFSDPVYGGNHDMVSWRMIGFPGAYASYYELVDQHGIKIDRPPTSLGSDLYRHIHIDPNIPAYAPPNNK
jgi:gluconate 2-dehydrogenase gamma chain